jgi:hypothetical protein
MPLTLNVAILTPSESVRALPGSGQARIGENSCNRQKSAKARDGTEIA